MKLIAKVGTERLVPDKSYNPKGRRFVPYKTQLLVLIKHYMSDLFNNY